MAGSVGEPGEECLEEPGLGNPLPSPPRACGNSLSTGRGALAIVLLLLLLRIERLKKIKASAHHHHWKKKTTVKITRLSHPPFSIPLPFHSITAIVAGSCEAVTESAGPVYSTPRRAGAEPLWCSSTAHSHPLASESRGYLPRPLGQASHWQHTISSWG